MHIVYHVITLFVPVSNFQCLFYISLIASVYQGVRAFGILGICK